MGYAASGAAASATWPDILNGTDPAVCISLHDLPTATGVDPTTPITDSSHEWNVARFRKMKVCLDDGTQATCYVFCTSPVSGGT